MYSLLHSASWTPACSTSLSLQVGICEVAFTVCRLCCYCYPCHPADTAQLVDCSWQEWGHVLNAHIRIAVIRPKSNRKGWWRCDQCPSGHLHSWLGTFSQRSKGSGCPQCSGFRVCKHNCLATKAPFVAAQWDYEANDGTANSLVAHSHHIVGWHCGVCGHKGMQDLRTGPAKTETAARSALV